MKVKVIAFGHFRDSLPDGIDLELAAGATVQDVCATILNVNLNNDGDGSAAKSSFRVAVNLEYVGFDKTLTDGDEVALIPPMSGG